MDNNLKPADLTTTAVALLEARDRLTQQQTLPTSAAPTVVEGIWTDFDPVLTSRWNSTFNSDGTTTIRDGVSTTPGFSKGNSQFVAQYHKRGQLVRLKLTAALGSTPLYTKGATTLVTGNPQYVGEIGVTELELPFPPRLTPHGGFALGISASTASTIDSGGIVTRGQLFAGGFTEFLGSDVSVDPNLLTTGYKVRLRLPFLDAWRVDPPVYYAASPSYKYAVAGERFVFFLKYHTET